MKIVKKNLPGLVLFSIALGLCLFAGYEVQRERELIPLEEELILFSGTVRDIDYSPERTEFVFNQEGRSTSFKAWEEINQLIDTALILPYFADDTFHIGYYNDRLPNCIATLSKNDMVLISYDDFYNRKWDEIKEGPVAAAIAFAIVSLALLSLIITLPYLTAWTVNKVAKGILQVPGIRQEDDNLYVFTCRDHTVFVNHEFKLGVSKQNHSYIRLRILLTGQYNEDQLKKLYGMKGYIKRQNKAYLEVFHQIPVRVNAPAMVRRVEKAIDKIHERLHRRR